jgi:hypothetical protein
MDKPRFFSPHDEGEGTTLLHTSCWERAPSGVRWCLRNGFDPNAEDRRGWTPLIWLVRMHDKHTRCRRKMFRWLIEAGAKIDHKDKGGQNLLKLARRVCAPSFYRFVRSEYKRLIRKSSGRKQSRAAHLAR